MEKQREKTHKMELNIEKATSKLEALAIKPRKKSCIFTTLPIICIQELGVKIIGQTRRKTSKRRH